VSFQIDGRLILHFFFNPAIVFKFLITVRFSILLRHLLNVQLLLLKRGGQVIYAGELGHNSCKLVEYFEVFSSTDFSISYLILNNHAVDAES
jgi:hypothetical protein